MSKSPFDITRIDVGVRCTALHIDAVERIGSEFPYLTLARKKSCAGSHLRSRHSTCPFQLQCNFQATLAACPNSRSVAWQPSHPPNPGRTRTSSTAQEL